MSGKVEAKLRDMGIELPNAPAPAANYVPFVLVDKILYVSGQISTGPNGLVCGKVGKDLTIEEGAAAARICAINLISQVKAACNGNLDRLSRVIKLTGFVNSNENFTEQPQVINGASDFMAEVFGTAGQHARAAVSASSLPFGVAVEVEGTFLIS